MVNFGCIMYAASLFGAIGDPFHLLGGVSFWDEHIAATGIELELRLNFGAERIKFKRMKRRCRPKPLPRDFIL